MTMHANSCKHGLNFEIATMAIKMATQSSPSEKSGAYTLLMYFRKIDPVVFPETCLQRKVNLKLPPWQEILQTSMPTSIGHMAP